MTQKKKNAIKEQVQNAMEQDALKNDKNQLTVVKGQITDFLYKNKLLIESTLPKFINPSEMISLSANCILSNPDLLDCSRESLLGCVIKACESGLRPSVLGEVYFVPFYNGRKGFKEAQYQLGYKGCLTLARRSGEIQTINANEVKENDKFSYSFGMNEHLDHVPAPKDRGEITHFYAYAKLKDGGFQFVVMSREEVNIIKASAKTDKVWKAHYSEMGKKTVIKRLCKLLPMSIEYADSHNLDDKSMTGEDQQLDFSGMLSGTLENSTDPLIGSAPEKDTPQETSNGFETDLKSFVSEMWENKKLDDLENWMDLEKTQCKVDALNESDSEKFKKYYNEYFDKLSQKGGFTNG